MNVLFYRRALLAALAVIIAAPSVSASALAPHPGWVKVVVDLSDQMLEVYDEAGVLQVRWPVSTGAPSTPTPTGTFKVHSKSRNTFALSIRVSDVAHGSIPWWDWFSFSAAP